MAETIGFDPHDVIREVSAIATKRKAKRKT
ncbi:hypothetical protein GGQ63_002720 [Prosthecomicrobium pneumaticum]|uniref:Uncharacterized protein n=1 Tax=Prosthecomicrobium pneumaticum TaxID=81895 RepID=A0A7W9L2L3_9HYPH|nr:hypothetical protein [Prosthecomicrobium pneumaticum]